MYILGDRQNRNTMLRYNVINFLNKVFIDDDKSRLHIDSSGFSNQ